MARNKSKRTRENPLTQQQRQSRQPKLTVRGQITQNTMFSGNAPQNTLSTGTTGTAARVYNLAGGAGFTDAVAQVTRMYQSYKFLPGTTYTYIPAVGVNTAGTVAIAYITNPEMIANFTNLLSQTSPDLTTFNNRVRTLANCKTGPVWQSLTVSMDPVYRRPRFDVNNNSTVSYPLSDDAAFQKAVNELDRDTQGAFLVSITGAPASTGMCRDTVHKKTLAYELSPIGET